VQICPWILIGQYKKWNGQNCPKKFFILANQNPWADLPMSSSRITSLLIIWIGCKSG